MHIEQSKSRLSPLKRGREVTIWINGQKMIAFKGETIAAVFFAQGEPVPRYSEKMEQGETPMRPGYFCGIGICFGCTLLIDGRLQRACLTEVRPGMRIVTHPGQEMKGGANR